MFFIPLTCPPGVLLRTINITCTSARLPNLLVTISISCLLLNYKLPLIWQLKTTGIYCLKIPTKNLGMAYLFPLLKSSYKVSQDIGYSSVLIWELAWGRIHFWVHSVSGSICFLMVVGQWAPPSCWLLARSNPQLLRLQFFAVGLSQNEAYFFKSTRRVSKESLLARQSLI